MKLKDIFFFCIFISFGRFLKIYILPPNSNNCALRKENALTQQCDGSIQNPYDDLFFAITTGVSQAKNLSDMGLFFYLYRSDILKSHIINSSASGFVSPFEDFQGEISMEGLDTANVQFMNQNFVFLINKALTIQNINFYGFDMLLENNSECQQSICCYPDPESKFLDPSGPCFLGNSKKILSLEKHSFIQTKGNLSMKNVTMNNFNSFNIITSLISIENDDVEIKLVNVIFNQISLSKSLIYSQSTNNFSIFSYNMSISKYNYFQVFAAQFSDPTFFNFENSSGIFFMEGLFLDYRYISNCFLLENNSINITLLNISLNAQNDVDSPGIIFKSLNSSSIIILNDFTLNTNESLIYIDNNGFFSISNGILFELQMSIRGNNNILNLNSVKSSFSFKNLASLWGVNNSISIYKSFFSNIHQTAFFLNTDSIDNVLIFSNSTFQNFQKILIYSYTRIFLSELNFNSFEINHCIFSKSSILSEGLIHSWRSSIISIKNSYFLQNYFHYGGLIKIYENNNSVIFFQCHLNSIQSKGESAIYSSLNPIDNTLEINECFFIDIISDLNGNINAIAGSISISNSIFLNTDSNFSNFIFAIKSDVKIYNITMKNSNTEVIGNLYLIQCNLSVDTAKFLKFKGDEGVFVFATLSNITLANILFKNFDFKDSFVYLEKENGISIVNCSFLNFIQGVLFFLENQNNVSLFNSNFSNIFILRSGILMGMFQNMVIIHNIVIINANSMYLGTIFSCAQLNYFSITNLTALNVSATFSAVCYIFKKSIIYITNSHFFNCSSQRTGGVINSNFAEVSIDNCQFLMSSAINGGVISAAYSKIVISNAIFNGSRADYYASAIYSLFSSIYLNSSNFIAGDMNLVSPLSSSVYIISNSKNNVSINDVVFSQEGKKINYVFYMEGNGTLFMGYLIFKNNVGNSMININGPLIQLESIEFVNNSIDGCIELSTSYENMTIQNIIFNGNSFGAFLISVENSEEEIIQTSITMNNIVFFANTNLKKSGNFLITAEIFKNVIQNIKCFENLMTTNSINQLRIFKFFKCQTIIVNNSFIVETFAQILASESCFIYMVNLFSKHCKENSKISVFNSDLVLESTRIFIENKNYESSDLSNFTFIRSQASNLSLISLDIRNANESDMVFSGMKVYNIDARGGFSISIINSTFSNDNSFMNFSSNVSIMIKSISITSMMGGMFVSNVNKLLIEDSNFTNLGLLSNYSAINVRTDQNFQMHVLISNSKFYQNTGILGGALFIQGFTDIALYLDQFVENVAQSMGAALYSKCTLTQECYLQINRTLFKNNWAHLGGSIFLEKLHIYTLSKAKFSNDSFQSPYLRKNFVMTAPYFLNLSSIIDEKGNEVTFGGDDQDKVVEINNGHTITLVFTINDNTNRKCTYDEGSLLVISKDHQEDRIQDLKGEIGYSKNGEFQLPNFQLLAQANVTYTLTIQMIGNFNIAKTLLIRTRYCLAGEYFDVSDESCLQCPLYSYSLKPPAFKGTQQEGFGSCLPCPDNCMCEGSKIIPDENYWISPSGNSTLILRCPSQACLLADFSNFNNEIKCMEGHQGALCIVCKKGYSKESFSETCEKCDMNFQLIGLMFFRLGYTLIFVSYQVYSKLFVASLKALKIKSVYLKIIRDHFNQIFLIFSISGVLTTKDFFSIFNSNANYVITGSTLNLTCFIDEKIDMFFFFIFSIFLSPLFSQFFISLVFLLIYLVKLIKKKKVFFIIFLKTCFTAFIVVCDTQYTLILSAFFKFFECTQLDSNDTKKFLTYAPHIECYSDQHIFYLSIFGIPCFFIWILGLPSLFYMLLLNMKRKKGLKRASRPLYIRQFEHSNKFRLTYEETQLTSTINNFHASQKKSKIGMFEVEINSTYMLAFLYSDFNSDMYYWSTVIMFWKIVMSVIVTFSPVDIAYQMLFMFYAFLIFIYNVKGPYKHESSMFLVKFSFFSNMMTVLVAMLDKKSDKNFYNVQWIIYLIIQILFFVYALASILSVEIHTNLEKLANYFLGKKNNKKANEFGLRIMNFRNKLTMNHSLTFINSQFPSFNKLSLHFDKRDKSKSFEDTKQTLEEIDIDGKFKKISVPNFTPLSANTMRSKFEPKSFQDFKTAVSSEKKTNNTLESIKEIA